MGVSIPCLVGNAINTTRDMKATGRKKLGGSYYLAQAGCLLGSAFGVGGVVIKGAGNTMTILNACPRHGAQHRRGRARTVGTAKIAVASRRRGISPPPP